MSTASRSVAHLNWVHGVTVKMTENWPADKETYQSSATENHLLWTIGHLAISNDWFRGLLKAGPSDVPEAYQKLFGAGSKPLPDRAAFPPIAELRAAFERTFAALAAAVGSLTEEDGLKPTLSETGGFCSDRADAVDKAIWHEGWHAGQLASLRKSLGLPSVIG